MGVRVELGLIRAAAKENADKKSKNKRAAMMFEKRIFARFMWTFFSLSFSNSGVSKLEGITILNV